MAKIISEGHLPEDHPIFTGRWVFSSHEVRKVKAEGKTEQPKSRKREPAYEKYQHIVEVFGKQPSRVVSSARLSETKPKHLETDDSDESDEVEK